MANSFIKQNTTTHLEIRSGQKVMLMNLRLRLATEMSLSSGFVFEKIIINFSNKLCFGFLGNSS